MKREIVPPAKKLLVLYRVIIVLILVLVLVLAAGTLYAIIRAPDSGPLFRIGKNSGGGADLQDGAQNVQGAQGIGSGNEATAVFSDIGRLRIPVAGPAALPGAATVILSVSFPYPANDRPFSEELASRVGDFRSIATGYFSSLPAERIARLDEKTAKEEILKRYNALLRLGKIETLYFTDFMVIE